MKANAEQRAFIEAFSSEVQNLKNGRNAQSILLSAVAGAGKTSTIVNALKSADISGLKVLLIAFNRVIVKELQDRVNDNRVEIKTINSLGMGFLYRFCSINGLQKPVMVEDRLDAINIDSHIINRSTDDRKIIVSPYTVKKYAKLLIANGHAGIGGNFGHSNKGVMSLTEFSNFYKIVEASSGIPPKKVEGDYIEALFNATISVISEYTDMSRFKKGSAPQFDFDDQLWLPVEYRTDRGYPITTAKYDVIIVDEAQDMSVINAKLIAAILKKGGMFVGVGDRGQAIYQFRGADHNSMDNLKKQFNCKEMHLNNSYRCAKNISVVASKFRPGFGTFATHNGIVKANDPAFMPEEPEYESRYKFLELTNKGDIVLGTTYNLMLDFVKLAYRQNKGFYCPELADRFNFDEWSNIFNSLNRCADNANLAHIQIDPLVDDWFTVKRKVDQLDTFAQGPQAAQQVSKKIKDAKEAMGDLSDVFDAAPELPIAESIARFQRFIEAGKTYNYGDIRLMSVHKSKGKEYSRVGLITTVPPKNATFGSVLRNLVYVGITRAIDELYVHVPNTS